MFPFQGGEGAGCNENGRWKNLDGKLIEKKEERKKRNSIIRPVCVYGMI